VAAGSADTVEYGRGLGPQVEPSTGVEQGLHVPGVESGYHDGNLWRIVKPKPATQTRKDFLPFALPDLDQRELSAVAEVLQSGWLTTGPRAHEFEKLFADYVGARYTVAVNSCTAALHLALEAAGVGPGDEVITSAYTFAATGEVVRYLGAKPVLVDVERESLNLNAELVEQAVTARTRAIIPVHLAGRPVELEPLYGLAAKRGLAVVEDAAHALPARSGGRFVGGDFLNGSPRPGLALTCFSFYATKTITTGEGGMIATDSAEAVERCRQMSLHGISKGAWNRYTAEGSWYYEILDAGYKYNMTDVAAAMGIVQLSKSDDMWRRRREIASRYALAFDGVPGLRPPRAGGVEQHAWHLYMLRLEPEAFEIERNAFIEQLENRNIGTSVHFIPLHLHPYYRETFGFQPDDFPVALEEYQKEISLPIYSRMTDDDVEDVIAAVLDVADRFART